MVTNCEISSVKIAKMRVLSLFDGISCARVALDRVGIPVEAYYACEIEPNAIRVSKARHPDIQHLGDVKSAVLPRDIDLLIGGSPCQDLSIAKKGREGLAGERSGLFWEYVRILKELKPKWFVLENVASMKKEAKDTISEALGVQPVLFDAALVSAQSRKRLFWTNLSFTLPTNKGIVLKDILLPEVDERFHISPSASFTSTAQTGRNPTKKLGYVGDNDHQAKRVYAKDGKLPALNVVCNSMVLVSGRDIGRKLKDGKRADNDPTAERVRRIELREDDKSGTLTSVQKDTLLVEPACGLVRKLTPVECERLQGLPDGYTEGVAITNRYKCLGNAFNVDVVAHILSCGLANDIPSPPSPA